MSLQFKLGSSVVAGRTESASASGPVASHRRLLAPCPFCKRINYAAKSGVAQERTSQISKGKPTLVGDLLAGSKLAEIASRARDAETLHKQIKDLLPDEISGHITGASRNEATVFVLVDSPAWASRVRFHAPDLLKWLAERFDGEVERIRVRVRPADSP